MLSVGLVFVLLNLVLAKGPAVRTFTSPTSSAVAKGVPSPVRLLTACAPVIDFDGAYWGPPGQWTLRAPAQPARATLVSEDRVVLVTEAGQRLSLRRLDQPVRLSRCASPPP